MNEELKNKVMILSDESMQQTSMITKL